MAMLEYLYIIIFFMVLIAFGAVGGYASAMIDEEYTKKDDTTKIYGNFSGFVLRRSLVLGIVAALTVPLFLSIASLGQGGVVEQSYNFLFYPDKKIGSDSPSVSHLLVLCGFCVVAAVSARRFVERLTDAVLKAVKKEVDEQNKPIMQRINEAVSQAEKNIGPNQELSNDAAKLLDVFLSQQSRNVDLIAAEKFAKKHQLDFEEAIDELTSKGFVREKEQEIGLRGWGGMRILPKMNMRDEWLKVLRAFQTLPERPRPKPENLAKEANISQDEIKNVLKQIQAWGLIAESTSDMGGYRITKWGRNILEEKAKSE